MLERVRATSLALLGLTAAVGLAMVALALNQGWPLIAGSSIPPIPPRDQAIEEATIAAGVEAGDAGPEHGVAAGRPRSDNPGRGAGNRTDGTIPATTGAPDESSELVVSPSAPAKPQGGDSRGSPKQSPAPAVKQPQQASEKPPAPPSSVPASSPAAPAAVAEPTPPAATTSEAPDQSNVPPWSNGKGHAYGRGGSDDDDGWDDDDGGDDHGHDDHGHHDDD